MRRATTVVLVALCVAVVVVAFGPSFWAFVDALWAGLRAAYDLGAHVAAK